MTAGVTAGISLWSRHRRCWMSGALCCVLLTWRCPRACSIWSCFYLHSCTLTNTTEGLGMTCTSVKPLYQREGDDCITVEKNYSVFCLIWIC